MLTVVVTTMIVMFIFGLGYLAAQLRLSALQSRAIKVLEREITEARGLLTGARVGDMPQRPPNREYGP